MRTQHTWNVLSSRDKVRPSQKCTWQAWFCSSSYKDIVSAGQRMLAPLILDTLRRASIDGSNCPSSCSHLLPGRAF